MPATVALKEQKAELLRSAKATSEKAKTEDRDLSDEEQATVEQLLGQVDDLDGQIEKAEKQTALMDRLNAGLATLPQSPAPKTQAEGRVVISGHRDLILDDPNKGFKSPREFLQLVIRHGQRPGTPITNEGLKVLFCPSFAEGAEFRATVGSDEQSTFSDPYGWFLIPEGFTPDLLMLEPEADPMGTLVTRIPMTTPTIKVPFRVDKTHTSSVSGGLRVYRRAQADTVSASRMTMKQLTLEATMLMGISHVTEELLTDSPISFAALLAASFQDEFNSVIVNERLNGTGVGQFLGINNSGCLITQDKEGGQAADTIVSKNIIKMRARCWRYGQASWIANHDCLPQLAELNLSSGTAGQMMWVVSLREDVPDTLMGRPLIFSEYPEKVGDAGDIIVGNWTQYLEGLYQPLESAESVHVRFVNHERTFKLTLRNAGAPWWDAKLTPKKGTPTLSPFVRLQARS